MSKHLITKSADRLKKRGYKQRTSAHDRSQRRGVTHTVFKRDGEVFLVRAKEYVYEGLASFGTGHVDHGLETGAWLVSYFDDCRQFYVFDPYYVRAEADRTEGPSKRSGSRDWYELPLVEGVTLGAFENGDRPAELAGENATFDEFQ